MRQPGESNRERVVRGCRALTKVVMLPVTGLAHLQPDVFCVGAIRVRKCRISHHRAEKSPWTCPVHKSRRRSKDVGFSHGYGTPQVFGRVGKSCGTLTCRTSDFGKPESLLRVEWGKPIDRRLSIADIFESFLSSRSIRYCRGFSL